MQAEIPLQATASTCRWHESSAGSHIAFKIHCAWHNHQHAPYIMMALAYTGYQFIVGFVFLLVFPLNILLRTLAAAVAILACNQSSGEPTQQLFDCKPDHSPVSAGIPGILCNFR